MKYYIAANTTEQALRFTLMGMSHHCDVAGCCIEDLHEGAVCVTKENDLKNNKDNLRG